jgi:hypothetical protein
VKWLACRGLLVNPVNRDGTRRMMQTTGEKNFSPRDAGVPTIPENAMNVKPNR